jgi:hypothetical protein
LFSNGTFPTFEFSARSGEPTGEGGIWYNMRSPAENVIEGDSPSTELVARNSVGTYGNTRILVASDLQQYLRPVRKIKLDFILRNSAHPWFDAVLSHFADYLPR